VSDLILSAYAEGGAVPTAYRVGAGEWVPILDQLEAAALSCGEMEVSEAVANSESLRMQALEKVMAAVAANKPVEVRTWSKAYQNLIPNANMFAFRPHRFGAIFETFGANKVPLQQDHRLQQGLRGGNVEAVKFHGDPTNAETWVSFQIRAVKPWAAIGLLDETVDRFSMGANPGRSKGCVSCSIPWCGESWTTGYCSHWPGKAYEGPKGSEWEGKEATCFMWVGRADFDAKAPATDAYAREYSAVVNPAIPGTDSGVPQVCEMLASRAAADDAIARFGDAASDAERVLSALSRAGRTYDLRTITSVETKKEETSDMADFVERLKALTEAQAGDDFDLDAWAEEQFGADDGPTVAKAIKAAQEAYEANLDPKDWAPASELQNAEARVEAAEARAETAEREVRASLIAKVVAARSAKSSLATADEEAEAASLGECSGDELKRHLEAVEALPAPKPPGGAGSPAGTAPKAPEAAKGDGLSEADLEAIASGNPRSVWRRP